MSEALIGFSGFVGSNILGQHQFDFTYNSKNIEELAGTAHELLVCAGAPGVKWKANQDPEADRQSIARLQQALGQTSATKVILISTVDVFAQPLDVHEQTDIDVAALQPYGKHRRQLELFVQDHFEDVTILRLPGLFGPGLKKNMIYDFIHSSRFDQFNPDSTFQFYNLEHIWADAQLALSRHLPILHLATPPVSVLDVATAIGDAAQITGTDMQPVHYDMQTLHADLFHRDDRYIATADTVLEEIATFVIQQRGLLE